jgi:protein ImuB
VEQQQGALRVAAVDRRAKALGLHAGLSLADARSRIPAIRVENINRMEDMGLLQKLAGLCEFFTPLFQLDGDAGLLMDITGCAHLFEGEEGLYSTVQRKFIRTQITFRMSIASTPQAAHAIARHMEVAIVQPQEMEDTTRRLPLAALEAADDTLLALKRAGLRTLGDLMDRPSQAFTARFGASLTTQLNRMRGHEDTRITPLRAPPDYMAERQFVSPLADMENVLAAFARLADIIIHQLEERGEGGRLFEAIFFRSDSAVRRIHIETAEGLRDSAALMRLLRLRLDGLADPLDAGFGFDALRLCVPHTEIFSQTQNALDGRADETREIAGLMDQYTVRLGRMRVNQFLLHDSHNPEREASRLSILEKVPTKTTHETPTLPRPLTLFDRPQLIEALAEVPDGPPLRFRWRHVLHDVAHAEGPERISPEWWRQDSATHTRDYYRVEDTHGYRFWVFREGLYGQGVKTPKWYVHGLFP